MVTIEHLTSTRLRLIREICELLGEQQPTSSGEWIAWCGENIVARDTTEAGLREQLDDLGLDVAQT